MSLRFEFLMFRIFQILNFHPCTNHLVDFIRVCSNMVVIQSPNKSVYWKSIFYFSSKTHVLGTQKNRLNETVLLSTQNMFKLMGKKLISILCSKFSYLNLWLCLMQSFLVYFFQLRLYCGLSTTDLRLTLPNIKSLLELRLGIQL